MPQTTPATATIRLNQGVRKTKPIEIKIPMQSSTQTKNQKQVENKKANQKQAIKKYTCYLCRAAVQAKPQNPTVPPYYFALGIAQVVEEKVFSLCSPCFRGTLDILKTVTQLTRRRHSLKE